MYIYSVYNVQSKSLVPKRTMTTFDYTYQNSFRFCFLIYKLSIPLRFKQ